MNRLTLSGIKRNTRSALNKFGFSYVNIMDIEWVGERCRYRDGSSIWFRTARVTLDMDGKSVIKVATISTDGSFRIA